LPDGGAGVAGQAAQIARGVGEIGFDQIHPSSSPDVFGR
jgi:hypothetical protein